MDGALILENGQIYKGRIFGCAAPSPAAEVVFNTGMVGYQEVITDPSYKGQMVVMTYPLIGNYGAIYEDNESQKPQVSGFIVREECQGPSNRRLNGSLADYLNNNGITAIDGIDTRKLTRNIRERGTMKGIIVPLIKGEIIPKYWQQLEESILIDHPVQRVTTKKIYAIPGRGKRVVVMDFGIKKSILEQLKLLDLDLIVVPCNTALREILSLSPRGLLLSNGPGDPKEVKGAAEVLRMLHNKIPIFGICLGHQLLALSLGADTFKLKFGHRGINHPVKDLSNNKIYITAQNHGYAVAEESLTPQLMVTHRNLHDNTIEGFAHRILPLRGIQYHPEAAPGPQDSSYLFADFLNMLDR